MGAETITGNLPEFQEMEAISRNSAVFPCDGVVSRNSTSFLEVVSFLGIFPLNSCNDQLVLVALFLSLLLLFYRNCLLIQFQHVGDDQVIEWVTSFYSIFASLMELPIHSSRWIPRLQPNQINK